MATRVSKKSAVKREDSEDETLNPKSMERLVTDFSKAIQTAMIVGVAAAANAITASNTAQYSATTTMKQTSSTKQYKNQSFIVNTKEGKYQWS